ncbi:hypothetical protein [Marinactinospora rubrisoli]|uniref:Uncharacterized protein n=1 Tax=Marinactinospora rubrisoli TaxID=2715399 RepID=A0ABW2KL48_9ACTN
MIHPDLVGGVARERIADREREIRRRVDARARREERARAGGEGPAGGSAVGPDVTPDTPADAAPAGDREPVAAARR